MDVRAEGFARLLGHVLLVGLGECMNDEQLGYEVDFKVID